MFERQSFGAQNGVDALTAALDQLAAVDLDTMSDAALSDELALLLRQQTQFSAQILRRIGVFDSRGIAHANGMSTSAWLRHTSHCNPGIARRDVQLARQLQQDEAVARPLAEGTISPAHATVIYQALQALPNELPDEHRAAIKEALLAQAAVDNPKVLKVVADRIRAHCDPDGADVDAKHAHETRWLDVDTTYDDCVVIHGVLDAEAGLILQTALGTLTRPTGPDDDRPASTRRADALVQLARQTLDSGELPDNGGTRPHVSITISAEDLAESRGSGSSPDHPDVTLTTRTVRRWLCDASVTRILLHPDGQPLDVGRTTRTIPPALRKALIARDSGCVFSGCDAPPSWCDGHHKQHWADGGKTSLENLVLLCRRHHTYLHQIGHETLPRRPDEGHDLGRVLTATDACAGRPPPAARFT
jgi:hypothetical protein